MCQVLGRVEVPLARLTDIVGCNVLLKGRKCVPNAVAPFTDVSTPRYTTMVFHL